MAKDEKTGKYKVKSPITFGAPGDEDGAVEYVQYAPGQSIDLTEKQAWEARHALENPPKSAPLAEGEEEIDEDTEEALESIRRRPDNADSGVMLHWKTDPLARHVAESRIAAQTKTKEVGHGFERANEGFTAPMLADPMPPRPQANKTEMEKEDEEAAKAAPRKPSGGNTSHKEPEKAKS